MSDKIFEGAVDFWVNTGPSSGYGFISYESGRKIDRVYFGYEDVTPDNIGRGSHAKIVGNLVRFRLAKRLSRGEQKLCAIAIQSVFPTDVPDPDEHREVSVVDHIVCGRHEELAAVFLKRPGGDKLYLSREGCAPSHMNQFADLRIGDHVWSAVRPPSGNKPTWRAAFAEFYSPEEELEIREEEIQKCERN